MTPSLRASRAKAGFTLIELLVASTLTALILAQLCAVYFATALDWESQSGRTEALLAANAACRRVADYVSQATGAMVVSRINPGDTLLINLPLDTAYNNTYIPIWTSNRVRYRSGPWIAFYLSDASGSPLANGDILWAGTVTWAAGSYTITPDSDWSLYYGASKGRVAPIKTLRFELDETGPRPTVTITAVSIYRIKKVESQLSMTRKICLRNTN